MGNFPSLLKKKKAQSGNQQSINSSLDIAKQSTFQQNEISNLKLEDVQVIPKLVVFKEATPISQISAILNSPQYKTIMEFGAWSPQLGYRSSFQSNLSAVKQWQGLLAIRCLSIHPEYNWSILQTKFSQLKKLNVQKCNLLSVEFVWYIDMPKLQQLNIANNFIISIKTLRKLRSPLKSLTICENFITNLSDQRLNQFYFSTKMSSLNFRKKMHENHDELQKKMLKSYGDDLGWFMKLHIASLDRYELCQKTCIARKKWFVQKMRTRYKGQNSVFGYGPQIYYSPIQGY